MKNSLVLLALTAFSLNLNSCTPKEPPSSEKQAETSSVSFEIQDVTPEEAENLLSLDNPPIVVDVRTTEEFSAGHLPGAIVVDFKSADFKEKLSKLDRTKEYLIHCRSGGRSTKALDTFKELEFGKIHHLNKGFLAWEAAQKPTE